jgi:hypothetical protein
MARLRHLRRDRAVDRLLGLEPERRISGRFNYGGIIINHFGHFMAEGMHRVVPSLRHHPKRRFLYVRSRHHPAPLPFMAEVWRHFGLEPPLIVDDNVEVDEMFVHEQGANYMGSTHAAYLDMLDDLDRFRPENLPPPRGGPRLYVSRTAVPKPPALLGESYLERLLAGSGFTIFRPEAHSVLEQIATYRAADVIVLGEGSAAHALELLGRGSVRNVFLYTRRSQESSRTRGMMTLLGLRSEAFQCFEGSVYLGSLAYSRTGEERAALGTTAINIPGLLESLRAAGFIGDAAFSAAEAIGSTREDFLRYVASGAKSTRHAPPPPDAEARLESAFTAAIVSIYGPAARRA